MVIARSFAIMTNNTAIWITRKHRADVNTKLLLSIDLTSRGMKNRMNITDVNTELTSRRSIERVSRTVVYDWSIAIHARRSLFLRIRATIFVRVTAVAWRHGGSSTVASNKGVEFSTALQVVCNIIARLESFLLEKWKKKHQRLLLPLFYSPASRLSFPKSSATLEPTPLLVRASLAHARHAIFCFRRLVTGNHLQKTLQR